MASFELGYPPSSHRSKRPGYGGTSLQEFFAAFPDDEACFEHVFKVRFGPDPVCPRCGAHGRWRKHHVQKHFFHPCGGIRSPMTGVVFSRSKIPMQLWFYAMLHFVNSTEGISCAYLARQLAISVPTAFRMSKRIRLHMALVDESKEFDKDCKFISVKVVKLLRVVNTVRQKQNSVNILLLSDGKRVNSTIIANLNQKTLRKVIYEKVIPDHHLKTDCFDTFNVLRNYSSGRPIAEFSPEMFFEAGSVVNASHGFMQYVNLSFADQFRGVNLENAWLYLKEYEYRYNRRVRSADSFGDMIAWFPELNAANLSRVRAANFAHS